MTPATDPVDRELAALCGRLFGMRPPDDGRLLAHVEARARRAGQPLEAYVARLYHDPAEQAALAAVATNGWTWFWREAPALIEACERLAARAPRRRMHAWVAGCSTGEEAFTLAIVAERAGLELYVLGTDVDPTRIAHARQALYAEAALRHVPEELVARYFERRAGLFVPAPRVRALVRFEVHNLLDPPPRPPPGEWDLVSCRNVMLHARASAAQRILANLSGALDPFGERVVSAVDELTVEEARAPLRPSQPPPAPSPRRPASRAPTASAASVAEPALRARVETRPQDFEAWLGLGNLMLAAHRLEEAAAAYAAAEALEPASAELSIMQGLLHRTGGRLAEAEEALRRALFLEPDLWLGWLLLAGVYERLGVEDRARRALVSSLSAIERRPRLAWRAPDGGVEDRRMDAATARRLCRARLGASPAATGSERWREER
ncbi:MAG: hypothetical protein KF729_30485 [Sandaracinaceae bacterium]|nr:hypothetical protein [Sandaracinaceae bacterium]